MRRRARGLPGRQGRRRDRGVRDAAGREDVGVGGSIAPTTYVGLTEIQLDLRDAHNLKEKRKVVSSLKAQLRQRFVAAVAEIEAHDDRRRAVLLCALVGGSEVRERTAELERFVEARCPDRCRFEHDLVTLADLRA